MKKAFCCLLFLLVILTGCEKESVDTPFLSVSPADDIFFPHEGTDFFNVGVKIQVITNLRSADWTVSSDKDWCLVPKYISSNYFTIDARYNPDPIERTATVSVTSRKVAPIYIKIRQAGTSLLAISPSGTQDISSSGGVIDVAVKSDTSWTVVSNNRWAVVGTDRGVGDGAIRVTVDANPNKEIDLATISFSGGGAYQDLVIRRAANPNGSYITIDPSKNQKFPIDGGKLTISISAKESWTVSSDKKWAVVETKKGTGNGFTRILVAKNTLNETDVATISFRAGTASRKLKIEREYTKPVPGYKYVKEGYTSKVVYTIDGKYIKEGYTSRVAYTIDGKYIKEGYTSKVAYTIDGKYIKEGYTSKVAYTVDGKYINKGYTYQVAYTLE